MDFNGKAVLVYLEEDNITKAYFRIKPLLSEDGPITAETLAALPDDGYLRIVPDRNEQHTFKERMRTMCGLCLLDLRNQPPEANKIRTNKNYNPSNGETNQFIVYSDAVRAMEQDLFYQVVSQNEAEKAATPSVYIRNGANIQGPVLKTEPTIPDDAKQLQPDSQELYSISVNGQELLFFWPHKSAQKDEAAVHSTETNTKEEIPAKEDAEPVSALDQIQKINKQCIAQTANLLNVKPGTELMQQPAAPQQPLTGTKLYSPGQRGNGFRRAHNPLMETVELQRYAAKQEAPGAVVNDSTALKDVPNPVDAFKRSLQRVCINAEDSRQAVDIILSCPGMQQGLSAAMSCESKKLALSAMNSQLQELEAERLMLLMQLDDAKKDMSSLKKEALSELSTQNKSAIDALQKEKMALEEANKAQQKAMESLNELRAKAQETIEKAFNDGNTVMLTRAIGQKAEKAQLLNSFENALKHAGFLCEDGDALSILTAYALSPDALYVFAPSDSDAALAAETLAGVFGAPVSLNRSETNVLLAPGGNTPAFIRALPKKDCTCIILKDDPSRGVQLPVEYPFALLPFTADMQAIPQEVLIQNPICRCSLNAFLSESKLNEEAISAINALRNLSAAAPLPISRIRNALRFVAATQNTFKGGVAEAIDRAVCHFILPHYLFCGLQKDVFAQYLTDMPRSLKIWNTIK